MAERVFALERDRKRLDEKLDALLVALEKQGDVFRELEEATARHREQEAVFRDALGLAPDATSGERGVLEEMDDSILRLEDYLLAVGERVGRLLQMLQDHKALLDDVSESVQGKGRRDRMRLELDIMMNSVSILAMAGIEIDPAIPMELDELRAAVREGETELEGILRRKLDLDRRLAGEVKRYDLDALYGRKKQLPGYG